MSKKNDVMAASDYLPERLPRAPRRETVGITKFGECSTPFGGGDILAEGVNLSPRRAPLTASRLPRGLFAREPGSGKPHGMVWFDGSLVFARGTGLYVTADGVGVYSLGTVSDTDKSFAAFGGRLYIYPDKLYMESGSSMPLPIELDTGVIDIL